MYNVLLYTQNEDGDFVLSNDSNVKTLRIGDNIFRDGEFTTWKTPLDYLESGVSMFYNANLVSWKIDLPNLKNGENMFTYTNIVQFHGNLQSITNGVKMFANTPLQFFSEDMNFLTNGEYMFQNSKIQHFSSYTKRLTNGKGMFKGCTNLSEFIGSLESLEDGQEMFNGCKLSPSSVAFIVDTIKKYPKKNITHYIDIGIDTNDNFNAITKFAQEAGYNTWIDLINALSNKGWGCNFYAHGKLIESDKINTSRTFDLSTFPKIGNNDATINGSFTISVVGNKASNCKATIKTNSVVLNGKPLQGTSEMVFYVPVNADGIITEKKNFDLLFTAFTDTQMYMLSGTFYIQGNEFGITIPQNPIEVVVSNDFVAVEYNDDGQVTGHNLTNLENGDSFFEKFTDITSFDGNLGQLKQAKYMFYGCSSLTSFNTDNIENLTDGSRMFAVCSNLRNVNANFTNLTNAQGMFQYCSNLNINGCTFPKIENITSMFYYGGKGEITCDFKHIVDGTRMFYQSKFNSIACDFSSLENGTEMFYYTPNLTLFKSELPALTNGASMFQDSGVVAWDIELPNLTNGNYMFRDSYIHEVNIEEIPNLVNARYLFSCSYNSSTNRTRFTKPFSTNLPKVKDGSYMFYRRYASTTPTVEIAQGLNLNSLENGQYMFCNTALTHFKSALPNLNNGSYMFYGCKLDKESVLFIVNQLKNNNNLSTTANITIGTSKEYQNDLELRDALGETSSERASQPGEKYPDDKPHYIETSIKSNQNNGTWKIKTIWY